MAAMCGDPVGEAEGKKSPNSPAWKPLPFWFSRTSELALPFAMSSGAPLPPPPAEKMLSVCGCSSDFWTEPDVATLRRNAALLDPFLADFVDTIDFEHEGEGCYARHFPVVRDCPDRSGSPAVRRCLEYLTIRHDDNELKMKLGSLFTFAREFLLDELLPAGAPKDFDTWDPVIYLLFAYLEHAGFIDHGVAIRCAWLNTPEENRRVPTPETRARILAWNSRAECFD